MTNHESADELHTVLPVNPTVLGNLLEEHEQIRRINFELGYNKLACTQIAEVFPGESQPLVTALAEKITPDPNKRGTIKFIGQGPIFTFPESNKVTNPNFKTTSPTYKPEKLSPVIPQYVNTIVLQQPYLDLANQDYLPNIEERIKTWSASQVDKNGNPVPHNVIIVSAGRFYNWVLPPLRLRAYFHKASPDDLLTPEVHTPEDEMWSQIAAIHPTLAYQLLSVSENKNHGWQKRFEGYVETQLLAHVEQVAKQWLPLISALGGSSEDELASAHNALKQDEAAISFGQMRDNVITPLVNSLIGLKWRINSGGYVIPPRMAHLLKVYHYIKDPEAWKQTLEYAIQMEDLLHRASNNPQYKATIQRRRNRLKYILEIKHGKPILRPPEGEPTTIPLQNP